MDKSESVLLNVCSVLVIVIGILCLVNALIWSLIDIMSPPGARIAFGRYKVDLPLPNTRKNNARTNRTRKRFYPNWNANIT